MAPAQVTRPPRLNPILTIGETATRNVATGAQQQQLPYDAYGQQQRRQQPLPLGPPPQPEPSRWLRPFGRFGGGGGASGSSSAANKANGGKGRYFAHVYVNDHFVDVSENVTLGDDFVATFSDVFSVQVRARALGRGCGVLRVALGVAAHATHTAAPGKRAEPGRRMAAGGLAHAQQYMPPACVFAPVTRMRLPHCTPPPP